MYTYRLKSMRKVVMSDPAIILGSKISNRKFTYSSM